MKNTTLGSIGALALALSSGASAIIIDPGPPPTATFDNVIVRDFRGDEQGPNAHPDFDNNGTTNGVSQPGQPGGIVAGMVANTLDADGKPVYVLGGGDTAATGRVHSADTFGTWFKDCGLFANSCVGQYNVPLTAALDPVDGILSFQDSSFFPLDALTPESIWDAGNNGHNYFFTLELTETLLWDPLQANQFSFTGDDDVWVFINGQLVLDLGGIHSARSKSFTLDAALAAALGVTAGNPYEFKLFFAERHWTQSTVNIISTLGPPPEEVPAPATMLLFATGLLGMRWSKKARKTS